MRSDKGPVPRVNHCNVQEGHAHEEESPFGVECSVFTARLKESKVRDYPQEYNNT